MELEIRTSKMNEKDRAQIKIDEIKAKITEYHTQIESLKKKVDKEKENLEKLNIQASCKHVYEDSFVMRSHWDKDNGKEKNIEFSRTCRSCNFRQVTKEYRIKYIPIWP